MAMNMRGFVKFISLSCAYESLVDVGGNVDVRSPDGVVDGEAVFLELLPELVGLVFELFAENRPWSYLGHLVDDPCEPPTFQPLDERLKKRLVHCGTNFLPDGLRKLGDGGSFVEDEDPFENGSNLRLLFQENCICGCVLLALRCLSGRNKLFERTFDVPVFVRR